MRLCTLCLLVSASFFMATASAQEEQSGVANYAYSIFSGTGKYKADSRTIYSIRVPLEFNLRAPDYESGKFGYKFLLPFAIGITDFDSYDDLPEFNADNLQTISMTPGVEMQIPVSANWQVKPFGQAGLGWDMKSSSNSFIWGVGARTRAWFGDNEKWLVGGETLWSGNNPKYAEEPDSTFTRLSIGTEYKWQTDWSPFGRRVSWHGRLIQYYFTHKVTFEAPPEEEQIRNSTEVGLSLGIDPPINIFGYELRQAGLAYEKADNGKAIKLIATFPF